MRNMRSLSLMGGNGHSRSVLHRTCKLCRLCQDLRIDHVLKLLGVNLTLTRSRVRPPRSLDVGVCIRPPSHAEWLFG